MNWSNESALMVEQYTCKDDCITLLKYLQENNREEYEATMYGGELEDSI